VQENATAMRKFWISKLNWKSLKTKHNLGNKFASPEAGPQEKILYKINEKKKREIASWKLTIGRTEKLISELTQALSCWENEF
jgi:hypothetical protein